jgi:hypothetical protein
MNMKNIATTVLMAIALFAGNAMAHDPKLHKGKSTSGEIVSIADDRFEMKTATGTTVVSFSSKTQFEHGNQKVDKTHLSKGAKVSVIGTKLPTGELVAREVMLGGAETAADHSNMKHSDKEKAEHKH